MRKVIDSNQLQSKNLLSYLSKSCSNFAVLTDYAAMEDTFFTARQVYVKSRLTLFSTSERVIATAGQWALQQRALPIESGTLVPLDLLRGVQSAPFRTNESVMGKAPCQTEGCCKKRSRGSIV